MPEPNDVREAEVLIQKYVAGQLSSEEAAQLLRRLKEEPALGTDLLNQMEMDVRLRDVLGTTVRVELGLPAVAAASTDEFVPNLVPLPANGTIPSQPSWRAVLPWATGLAAALALMAGYGFWPDHDPVPRLARTSAGVEVRRGQDRLPATRKLHLQTGDSIETGPGQSAMVEFAREGTRLEVSPETRLDLLSWENGKQFVLHHGKVAAVVARQPDGEPMVVTTPEAEARVRGTEFSLSSQWDATWLNVSKGVVELRGKSAGNSESVAAGQFAVAARSVELKAFPIGQSGLRVPVPVEPQVVSTGGDGDWQVAGNTVRQSRVSRQPDSNPVGPARQSPFSWYSRRIPVEGSLETSMQVRLDAAVEEPGPLGFTEFGFTLILDRKHLSFLCGRNPKGKGGVKLHSFVFNAPPTVEYDESEKSIRTPLASQVGQTFQLKARLTRLTPDQVHFQAKVWHQGENEPADWQLDAIRDAPLAAPLISLNTRRCACTFSNVQVVLIE